MAPAIHAHIASRMNGKPYTWLTTGAQLHKTLMNCFQFYDQQRLHSSIGYRAPPVLKESLCS